MKSLNDLKDHELTALLAATRNAVTNGAEEWEDTQAQLARTLSEQYGVSWDFQGWQDTAEALEQIRYERD